MKIRLIPPISTIISQQSKEKYGLVIAKQEALSAHLAMGTTWEFSQNLLLDCTDKNSNKSLRQVIMDNPSSKFPGKPVFHTLDPAWGSDNGVTFTFIPENEAEARMYIAGMVPYIREMYGNILFRAFSADAIDRHADSIFDPVTKQISLTTDVWIQNSLAIDDEFNYTDIPNEAKLTPVDYVPGTKPITTPQLYRDQDSISTFRSRTSAMRPSAANTTTLSDEPSANSSATKNTNNTSSKKQSCKSDSNPQETSNLSQTAEITVDSSVPTVQVSGLSSKDTRLGHLEQNMTVIRNDFQSALQQLDSRQQVTDRQFLGPLSTTTSYTIHNSQSPKPFSITPRNNC